MRRLILLGTVTFVAGLVLLFPARVAYSLFAPDALRLVGIGGTVWHATAAEGAIAGVYLRNLELAFRPTGLLRGQLAFAVSVEPAGGFLDGEVAVAAGGSLTLSDLEAGLSIGALQNVVSTPGIEGSVRLDFDRLTLADGFPTAADGSLEVLSLVARGLSPSPIGDFRAELVSGDDAITGSLEDLGGALDLAGTIRLSPDRSYLIEGLVAPTAQASPGLVSQLRFLGSANDRGQRPFRFEGRL